MRSVRAVLNYLASGGVKYIFGIPAGSVNAFFDELHEFPDIQPIVAKHEGGASYMANKYAKETGQIAICIGSSGPGATNLLTGAANAMREHLPILFITGNVPVQTIGLNASQELDAEPLFRPVTKYSVTVKTAETLLAEVVKAVEIALSGVPGPVHLGVPIDVQLSNVTLSENDLPQFPLKVPVQPQLEQVKEAARKLSDLKNGLIFAGQGARGAIDEVIAASELLGWPIVTTPQAKGLLPESTPWNRGVFGFAGHETASDLVTQAESEAILIVGSSLGETATSNYNNQITAERFAVQIDMDGSVFNRFYKNDISLCGDAAITLQTMIREWQDLGLEPKQPPLDEAKAEVAAAMAEMSATAGVVASATVGGGVSALVTESATVGLTSGEYESDEITASEFDTKNVLLRLQECVPSETRYTVDIGEFMSYVIHHMQVKQRNSFDINVHFGPMGIAIGSAIGLQLADPESTVVCITGDGCFFMHGMEILTAKENNLPILFVVMNNSRLGMVYHGHMLQYGRSHASFQQEPVNIAAMVAAMGIPTVRIEKLEDLQPAVIQSLMEQDGPALVEVMLVDNNVPPMGDRVKFLSSFGK